MGTLTIATVFVGSALLAVLAFRAHGRWAGPDARAGARSMAAFVVGWLLALAAAMTGLFLASALLTGGLSGG